MKVKLFYDTVIDLHLIVKRTCIHSIFYYYKVYLALSSVNIFYGKKTKTGCKPKKNAERPAQDKEASCCEKGNACSKKEASIMPSKITWELGSQVIFA